MDSEKKVINDKARKKRIKTIKTIILVVVLLLLIFAGMFLYGFYMKNERLPWQAEKIDFSSIVRTTTVKEGTYTTSIDVSGSVEPYDSQTVQMRATGAVTSVLVKEGDYVTKGQLLATVDDTDQQYDVANIEMQIQAAKLGGTASKKDIELLEMKLKSAEKKLDNTKAYANFDGVVVSVSIEEGDYYEAGSTVMKIIDNSRLKATVEVDEIDIQMVEVGMPLGITSDSTPGVDIEGYVSYIPMIGRYSNQGIGVMDVEIVIDNPPESLKPGFSFEGTINIESEQSMLMVSQSAVTTNRGTNTVTRQRADGTTERIVVQVKYLGEGLYQILGGDIKNGDTLIINSSGSSSGMGAMGAAMGAMGGSMGGSMGGGSFGGGGMGGRF